MSEKLKPCPFCGGAAEAKWRYRKPCEDACYWVHCPTCGANTRACETEAEAVAAWNMRTAAGDDFSRAVHDGNLWRKVKGRKRCGACGLNIESVIALDGCNAGAVRYCPNCGKEAAGA